MLFEFEHPEDLLTPIINHGGVNDVNPLFTSSDLTSLDDQDICFSSNPSKKNEYESNVTDNSHESNNNHLQQQQQHDDLYSTFDFPVLSEISRIELQNDGSQFDKYIGQCSLQLSSTDTQNISESEDSTFYPIDDSTSSTGLWVSGECTIESKTVEDMSVPLSPSVSSASSSPATSKREPTRKRNLSTLERKLRKKGQNKTAAEKYRLKKRSERDELFTRHAELKNQNRELKFEMENMSFQLEQFKQLFVDILQIPIPPNLSK